MSRGVLMLTLLPHALPELVALFLPLAAWMVASRREAWNELLAATAVTTAVAAPVLVAGRDRRGLRLAQAAARRVTARLTGM